MDEDIPLDDLNDYGETAKSRANLVNNEKQSSFVGCCETFRRRFLQSTVFQLVVFIVFLTVLSIVTFGTTSTARFHMTEAIKTAFVYKVFGRGISFSEISSLRDVWTFLEEVALRQLFPLPNEHDSNWTSSSKYVLDGNVMLGIPRLKQIRVRNDSCRVHDDFRAIVSVCFDAYSEEVEDTDSFGYGNGTAWVYSTEKDINSMPFWGQISIYGGGGCYEDLGTQSRDPFMQLEFLKRNTWIDIATRILVLDFTLYNVNVNLFSVVKLMFEFPAGGGVWSFDSIRTINLLRYITSWDYFVLVLEFLFCAFTLYYLIVEIIEIASSGLQHFMFKWNWMDFIILILSIICIAFGIHRTVLLDKMLQGLTSNSDIFYNFERLGFWQMLYDAATAVLVFLSWIKIFKYLTFNETMIQLSTTLTKCAKDVGGFAVMFFVIFLAYAQLGYLLFGPHLQNFSKVKSSIFTLMRLILGDFDYIALERANRIMGPVFFITFVFFVFIILLNMFLAILSDTYTQIKSKMDKTQHYEGIKIGKVLEKIVSKFRNFFKKPKTTEGINESIDENKRLTNNVEVENKEPNQQRGDKEELEKATQNDVSKIIKGVSVEDFENLSVRVDDLRHEMDQIQLAILRKMNIILQNIDKLSDIVSPA